LSSLISLDSLLELLSLSATLFLLFSSDEPAQAVVNTAIKHIVSRTTIFFLCIIHPPLLALIKISDVFSKLKASKLLLSNYDFLSIYTLKMPKQHRSITPIKVKFDHSSLGSNICKKKVMTGIKLNDIMTTNVAQYCIPFCKRYIGINTPESVTSKIHPMFPAR